MGADDGFGVSKQQNPPRRLKIADHAFEVKTFEVGAPNKIVFLANGSNNNPIYCVIKKWN